MTRRRNPPPRHPQRPLRPLKDKDQLDSELRTARANRRAESQQKLRLRRHEWDDDLANLEEEPAPLDSGGPRDEVQEDIGDEEGRQESTGG